MFSAMTIFRAALLHLALLMGLETTLYAARQPATARSAVHETRAQHWCLGGLSQFSAVANTFVARAFEIRDCTPAAAPTGDKTVATLTDSNWKLQSSVTLVGTETAQSR